MKIAILILATAAMVFGETVWNASWQAAKDYRLVSGAVTENGLASGYYLQVYDSNDSLLNEFNVKETSHTFTGPDSICCIVKAYDTSGNVGPVSDVFCVQVKTGNKYDLTGDGKVTGADVIDLRLKVLFGSDDPKYDLTGDGKLTGADVTALKLYIKENN